MNNNLKIFQGLSKEEIKDLLIILEIDEYKLKRKESLFRYTRLNNSIGLLQSGRLKVVDRATDTILEIVESDELFGVNLTSASYFEIDIIALEGSSLAIIDIENIKRVNNNQFIKNIFEQSLKCLSNKSKRISVMANRNIRDKLLAYFRTRPKIQSELILPFSYTDLANYLAIDRSAMYKEIHKLEEDGLISLNGKRVKLKI